MTGIITVESVIVQTAEEQSAGLPEPLLSSQTFDIFTLTTHPIQKIVTSYSERFDSVQWLTWV